MKEFKDYLKIEKKASENTCQAYGRDISAFLKFLQGRGIASPERASQTDVVAYLMELKNDGKSRATANRKLSSIRTYYRFLIKRGLAQNDPTEDIKSPKIERKEIDYLTVKEIERFFDTIDDSTKGVRDRAMLEVLYATGIRVSELVELTMKDVNLKMGFITCNGSHGRARIVPMGRPSRKALENYLETSRKFFMKDRNPDDPDGPVFVNYKGEPMSRQGFWKVLKQYAEKANLKHKITPQIFRVSFAVHMIQNGADPKSLQELMGTEDMIPAELYISIGGRRIKDVYDRSHPRA